MADVKGLDCLLKVGITAATPASYTTLEGQTGTSFSGGTAVADTTAKDNAGWQTGMATTRSGVVNASGNLRTPRPMLDLLETAWRTGITHDCTIIFDSSGKGYKGPFYVTSFDISGDTSESGKYSVTLTPAAALLQATGP